MGYNSDSTGYRLFYPTTQQVVFSRDVKFDEHSVLEGVESRPFTNENTLMLGDTEDSWFPAPSSATQRVPAKPSPIVELPEDLQDTKILVDEDAHADGDIPGFDDRVEAAPYKPPLVWARKTMRDSGI